MVREDHDGSDYAHRYDRRTYSLELYQSASLHRRSVFFEDRFEAFNDASKGATHEGYELETAEKARPVITPVALTAAYAGHAQSAPTANVVGVFGPGC